MMSTGVHVPFQTPGPVSAWSVLIATSTSTALLVATSTSTALLVATSTGSLLVATSTTLLVAISTDSYQYQYCTTSSYQYQYKFGLLNTEKVPTGQCTVCHGVITFLRGLD